jgi:acetyl-CoA carboxylase biotin carboxyl carrier protein
MSVDIAYLRKLIEAFEQSDWDEIHLRGEDFEIRLSTSPDGALPAAPATAAAAAPAAPPAPQAEGQSEPTPAANGAAPRAEGEPVLSPSVGIFWRAPSPTSPPFVEVGDEVGADSTVCIVEVMKLMTQVAAGVPGRVVEILVANGEPVEKGQALFTVAT